MKILITISILLLVLSAAQDPEEVVYEEEEIDLFPTDPPLPTPEPEAVPQQTPVPARRPLSLDLGTLKVYQNEVLAVVGIFVYLLMYLRGKRANVAMMERFYRKVAHCLEANFAHVGFTKTSGDAPFNG